MSVVFGYLSRASDDTMSYVLCLYLTQCNDRIQFISTLSCMVGSFLERIGPIHIHVRKFDWIFRTNKIFFYLPNEEIIPVSPV